MSHTREGLVFKAKLAEQSERYEDMVTFMKEIALSSSGTALALQERNLFSVAYKNVIGLRRSAWRAISSLYMATQERSKDESELKSIAAYREKVEEELQSLCSDVLSIIKDHLLPGAGDAEGKVFFLKMSGDYHRYLAEFKTGPEHKVEGENAESKYSEATKIAAEELKSTHPIRLGLALNYSVMMYEILNDKEKACETAKVAFDDAISELDQLEEDSYKDATLIMQLLRDNLTLWTSEESE